MNWTIIETVGSLIGSIAGYSTATSIIKAFIPSTASIFKKTSMLIGATLIGSFIGGKCAEEAKKTVKEAKELYNSIDDLMYKNKTVKE